jgi:hypothetical protein
MKFIRIAVVLFVLISSLLAVPNTQATLIPSPDGMTVYDTVLKVNWLANANLAGTPANLAGTPDPRFGVANITPGGSMNYSTAVNWVAALNLYHDVNYGGIGYLGHNNWQLPTTPHSDTYCSATGPLPYQGSFGYGCLSDLGTLYNSSASLHLQFPDTAVPIPNNTVGPFSNFQPYLYWTDTSAGTQGYHTFSLNTGWAGSNVDKHYMYALPMIPGNPFGIAVNGTGLQVSADGKTVYDPEAVYDLTTGAKGVTWLADANLAKTRKFGAQCTKPNGEKCINTDGSMTHKTAHDKWIKGMNAYHGHGYLDQANWQLPPDPMPTDPTMNPCGGFNCTDTPLGHLYYFQLGLSPVVPTPHGVPVVQAPSINVGPFNHIQPYLYWSSCQPLNGPSPCLDLNGIPTTVPAPKFEWSFSFGNGFQGTDLQTNDLYVMVYFPQTPEQAADTTPPVTTAGVSGPLGLNGWYVGSTVVNFTATDDLTGVFKTEFSLDNGTTWASANSVSLSASAIYNILYRSTDFVGNIETPKSIIVKLDTKPPVTTVTTRLHKIQGVTISLEVDLNAFDNLSGVAATEYSLDHAATWTTGKVLFLCGGTRTILFRSTDVAGNVEKRQSITLSTPLCGASGGP